MTNLPTHIDFQGKVYDKPSLESILTKSVIFATDQILLIESVERWILSRRDIMKNLNMSPTEYLLWLDNHSIHKGLSWKRELWNKDVLKNHPTPSDRITDEDSTLYKTTKKIHGILIDKKWLPESTYLPVSEFTRNEVMILQTLSIFAGKVVPNHTLYWLTQIHKEDIWSYWTLKVFMFNLNAKLWDKYKIVSVKWRWFMFQNSLSPTLFAEVDALISSIVESYGKLEKSTKRKKRPTGRDPKFPEKTRALQYLKDMDILKSITRDEAFLLFSARKSTKIKIRLMRAIHLDKVISKDDLMKWVDMSEWEYGEWYELYESSLPKNTSVPNPILELEVLDS